MPLRSSCYHRTLHEALVRPSRKTPTKSTSSLSSSSSPEAYVWISDDILANAYTQLSRITLPALRCKRHGSSVPGPLEANRRLAKRRMAGQVVARQGQFGSDGSGLANLLTFGHEQQTEVGRMTWEAPSLSSVRGEVKKGIFYFLGRTQSFRAIRVS